MNELRNTINIQFSVHGTVAARLNISNHIRLVGFKRLISLLFSVNTTTTNNNNKSLKTKQKTQQHTFAMRSTTPSMP